MSQTHWEESAKPSVIALTYPSRRLALIQDAIEIVLRHLSTLPSSPDVEDLRLKAESCLQQAQRWPHSKPAPEERETLMKRVLAIHVAVAKLERQTTGT
jgi:hypothetical protein